MDDQTQPQEQALKDETSSSVAEDSSQPTPPADEPTTSPSEETTADTGQAEPAAPSEEPKAEATEEGERGSSQPERQQAPPAQRRIRQLVEENKQLKQQLGQTPLVQTPQQAATFAQMLQEQGAIQENGTIDPAKMEEVAKAFASQQGSTAARLEVANLEQKIVQEKAYNQLELDTERIEKEPEFDPKSDRYVPGLEEKVSQAYEARAVRLFQNQFDPNKPVRMLDPNVRFADIANEYLEVARSAAERGKALGTSGREALADTASVTPTPETNAKPTDTVAQLKESLADIKF